VRDISGARILLEEPAPVAIPATRPNRLAWALLAAVSLVAGALGIVAWRHGAEEKRVYKLSVLPPENTSFGRAADPAVSPDGRRLAFCVQAQDQVVLAIRDLDSPTSRALPGTEGCAYPFWSPDSRTVAFFAGQKLRKIDAAGGTVVSLCDASAFRGGTWNRQGVILFAEFRRGIFRLPAAGGTPKRIVAPDPALNETSVNYPWFLPDGRHFLYTARNAQQDQIKVFVTELESSTREPIETLDSNVNYVYPGYLLFERDRILMAQPFDAARLRVTGDAAPVADPVQQSASNAYAQFSSALDGILAYLPPAERKTQMTWLDRTGKVQDKVGSPGVISNVRISPNGTAVAFERLDLPTGIIDIWLFSFTRNTTSRFTFGRQEVSGSFRQRPVWSPDGESIAFATSQRVYRKAVVGGQAQELSPLYSSYTEDWSRDGRYIVETTGREGTNTIALLPLAGDRKPTPYSDARFSHMKPRLSPDARWLAYQSNESGRYEVYVQAFPEPHANYPVSTGGGTFPVWSRDGKELFFLGDGKMMAVPVTLGANFQAGVPKPLFDTAQLHIDSFDVANDGRFLVPVPIENPSLAMNVIINWTPSRAPAH
jgi:hypothetical protein